MWKDCQALQDEITALRRELHQIPEVGAQLPETAACLSAHLDRLGIPFVRSPRDSGLIASIQGGLPGRTVALRADMDALPIQEETGLPFSSRRPGVMHACGHDAHAAMLMGAAQVLQKHRKELRGTVRLLFQPAEEQCEGAKVMLEQGALDGVDAIFGFHIGTLLGADIPSGTVIAPSGCCMAAFDKFTIRVRGRGCHGSTPEKGVDPVNAAAHIVLSLQAITTREISAARSLVLTIGRIQGGDQYNIIPDEVVLEGTIRTLEDGLRQYAARRIGEVAQAAAAVFGASADCTISWGAPPVLNDPTMAELAAGAAAEVVGPEHVVTRIPAPNMGGEDFAFYLEQVPGAFLFLSSSDPAKGTDLPHHSPRFDVDESVLWKGAALYVSLAQTFLNG